MKHLASVDHGEYSQCKGGGEAGGGSHGTVHLDDLLSKVCSTWCRRTIAQSLAYHKEWIDRLSRRQHDY